jgi:hypothetical protein
VPDADADGEKPGELRVGQQPLVEDVDNRPQGGPPPDLLIQADRGRDGDRGAMAAIVMAGLQSAKFS